MPFLKNRGFLGLKCLDEGKLSLILIFLPVYFSLTF